MSDRCPLGYLFEVSESSSRGYWKKKTSTVGHCSLGSRVPLTSTVGWDTEAGLECTPQLVFWVGH